MKHVLLFSFLSMGILPVNSQLGNDISSFTEPASLSIGSSEVTGTQPGIGNEHEQMLAVTFRSQDVCRAELKDFVFDIQYNIVSATVYFSGTNFRGVETGYITSASLKPIRSLMARCAPGTMVVFDRVKVKGPDKELRTIQGTSYMLK
ncbi:MAG: hypothetical protein IPI88_15170 [Chitinophagaceae bacterium]|nr:hypothetical protein [Chitinophagaceae bacterium]